MSRIRLAVLFTFISFPIFGKEIRVPEHASSIQAGIDQAVSGDTVIVSPGIYRERITIAPGITVRSLGKDVKPDEGLKRAEQTIIDGGGNDGDTAGVELGQGSVLDGFTVTNVGVYDEQVWNKH